MVVRHPGRLRDVNGGDVAADRVSTFVLDEADGVLDLVFASPRFEKIAGATRADRQTVMFSAAWPQQIQGLAARVHVQPAREGAHRRRGPEGAPA